MTHRMRLQRSAATFLSATDGHTILETLPGVKKQGTAVRESKKIGLNLALQRAKQALWSCGGIENEKSKKKFVKTRKK